MLWQIYVRNKFQRMYLTSVNERVLVFWFYLRVPVRMCDEKKVIKECRGVESIVI